MNFSASDQLRARARELIPGGAHTYAKGVDQFPLLSPGFIARGNGSHVWDVDGNEFIEYGSGLRSVTLGHAYPDVVRAAAAELERGVNFVCPSPREVELAEQMLALIPSAGMIKFAKHGSDATSAAVRLTRAYTGRDRVAVCRQHPFFSVDDWFIGTTPVSAGIPASTRELVDKFDYNDLASLDSLLAAHPGEFACVMMEAEKETPPAPGFLQAAIDVTHRHGALFVLDEMITGFRWHLGGAQALYGVSPDLSCFGKGMANGFSVSALAGPREIMRLGGLDHDRDRVFLLSTTHGGETHALAAALATLAVYRSRDVIGHLHAQGRKLVDGINPIIKSLNLEGHFELIGRPCNLVYATRDESKNASQTFRALFLQETIARGLLAPSLVTNFSHDDADVNRTIEAVGGALAVYRKALEDGVERHLIGGGTKPVYRARC